MLFFDFVEEPEIDLRFSCVFGDEVPHVADLALANAVYSPEALLDAVRVPRQVVVDDEVGALQVDAFAGGVGGDKDQAVLVLGEPLLDGAAFFAAGAS